MLTYIMFSRAGLTSVPVVPWEGAPDQLPNFDHAVLMFDRLETTSFV